MLIKSNCIFDSIKDQPFKGYIITSGSVIKKVAEGEPSKTELEQEKQIIDCGDKTVMPGFCDNHVHVFLAALDINTCNLHNAVDEDDAAEILYEFYKDRDDKWIVSFGWCHYDWTKKELPQKSSLDKYFPDRPVIAINDELHALWVNSKALEICGVNNETTDPIHGMIARDEFGELTGYILEQSAMTIFSEKAFSYDRKIEKEMIKSLIRKANEKGVTAVGDMEIIDVMKTDAYRELEEENSLDLRIFFSPSIRKSLEDFLGYKKKYCTDRLSLLGAKGFIDGTPLGYTGMLVEEYSDRPGFFGSPVIDLKWLKDKIVSLNKNNIPVRLHACGDGAVREALDDIELAEGETEYNDIRNTIEHIEMVHIEDLDRFKKTKTIASIQPNHMSMETFEGHAIFDIAGEKRSKLSWPAKTLVKHGARVALGTDCPIVPLEPLQTIYCAINRVMEDGTPTEGFNPQEKFTLSEALKGCTKEVSYLMKKEDKIGTLEVGKYADIIMLSENLFSMEPLKIREAFVEKTVFNGKLVFEK